MDKKTPEQIKEGLANFYGTDHYYRHMSGLTYTDGIKYLADSCGAYWLLDVIGSYQPQCRKDESLRDMQFWTFNLSSTGKSGVVKCERDEGEVFITQKIPMTDFPLPEIRIWVEAGGPNGSMVMMLPSER